MESINIDDDAIIFFVGDVGGSGIIKGIVELGMLIVAGGI